MSTTNPWIGLKSYQEGETLYGRGKDVLALSQCIINNTQTVVYGKSGIGKSSVIEAGIFPIVRKIGIFPVRIRLEHNAEPYNRQIFRQILFELGRLRKDSLNDAGERVVRYEKGFAVELTPVIDPEKESLWEFFHRYEFHDENGERLIPMPVLDQFEEIFTLESDPQKITDFFGELADLLNGVVPDYVGEASDDYSGMKEGTTQGVNDDGLPLLEFKVEDSQFEKYLPSSDFHFVITLREDFLSYLERYTENIPCLKQNRFCLQSIDEEQAIQIITKPIPGIASQETAHEIISKVTGSGQKTGTLQGQVDSAILSLYLSRLYDKMAENGKDVFSDDLIKAFGDHIIRDFYHECIAGINPASIRYLEDKLVNTDGFRESISVANVIQDGIVSPKDIATLKERHLIHDFSDSNGVLRIEYIHDKICDVVMESKKNHEFEEKNQKLLLESQRLRAAQRASRRRIAALGVISLLILALSVFSIQRNAKLRKVNKELENRKETILDLMSGNVTNVLDNGDSYAAKRICLEILHSFYQDRKPVPDSFRSILRSVSSQEDAILKGHTGSVTDARFSPDGAWVATASEDSTVMIWNAKNGNPVRKLADFGDYVLSVAFSPDSRYLAAGSRDNRVRLFDVNTGECRWESSEKHDGWVRCVIFSPDGESVISASKDKTLKVWNAENGRVVRTIGGHKDEVLYVTFAPGGKWIATSSADKTVILWNARDYTPIHTFSGHSDWVRSVEFHPDNTSLVSASDDGTVRLWDLQTHGGRVFRKMTDYVTRATYSADGKRIVTSSRDGNVAIWNSDGSESFQVKGKHNGWVNSVSVSRDGKRIVSGSTDLTARIIDLNPVLLTKTFHGHSEDCRWARFLPSGREIISYGKKDERLILWNLDSQNPIRWEIEEGRISSFAVHPEKPFCAIGHYGSIDLRSLQNGESLPTTLEGASGWIYALDFSPDGKWIAGSGINGIIRIWNAEEGGKPVFTGQSGSSIWSLKFSPDGKTLASGNGEGLIQIWDFVSGKDVPVSIFQGHSDAIFSIVFSKDGERLLTASKDKYAKIWRMDDGACLKTFSGSSGLLNQACFNQDEKEVLTISSDHVLRIWDVQSQQCIDEWKDPVGSLVAFDLDFERNLLATASWDGSVKVWRYPSMEEIVMELYDRFGVTDDEREKDGILGLL